MKHRASRRFWQCYHLLPPEVQRLADANFELLKQDPRHPSLHFKKVGRFFSARVGLHYRALGIGTDEDAGVLWFWVGHHSEYDRLITDR